MSRRPASPGRPPPTAVIVGQPAQPPTRRGRDRRRVLNQISFQPFQGDLLIGLIEPCLRLISDRHFSVNQSNRIHTTDNNNRQ